MTHHESSLTPNGDASEWFGALFKDLAAAYPSMKVSERQVRVYAMAMTDLTPEQVRTAMGRAILECRFFPAVAELRGMVSATADDRAVLAWASLREAVAKVGIYESIEIEDACAAEALTVASGSWTHFCELEEGPALMVTRQTFLAAYRDAVRRHRLDAPVRLPGLCEASGQYDPSKPVWVGRIARTGHVSSEREQAALPSAASAQQLPAGKEE